MRLQSVELVLRDGGFFHYRGQRIKAVYPKRGYAVMVFLEDSPIDLDFGCKVWVPKAAEVERILRLFDKSDRMTYELLGHGWEGERPFHMLEEFV